ncbi:MAG: efflux RND transporter permease subunit [Wenzhouxiangellaceae bacterium]
MFARALDNPRLLGLLAALIVVSGLAAYAALPTTEDPRVLNRIATVLTPYPGATPERVEALVSEPIEEALRTLPEVDVISSTSQAGLSVIRVELKDAVKNTEPVWSQARDKLADVQPQLPDEALPSQFDDDRGYAFTRIIALRWQGQGETDAALLGRYGEELAKRLRAVSGMDLVENFGEPEEEIQVMIDPVAAAQAGLSALDIASAIDRRDAKVAAGQLRSGEREWLLEVSGELDTLASLSATVLREGDDGRALRLHDVAEVRRGLRQPQRDIALVGGAEAVIVAARMLPDVRIDVWSRRVDDVVSRYAAIMPANIELSVLFDQEGYTNQRLGGLLINVLVGFAIILSVLFLTLGWRAAITVALALPLTVAFTLACMRFYGLPIHQMSVTGLVVALGIMVDNAIVMTDTIQRLLQQGHSRLAAISQALRHLWIPLAGSTLTTILAFAPIAIMPGPAGEFVGGIALSVIFSLIGSYLISHTLIAGIAGRFLRPGQGGGGMRIPWLTQRFQALLRYGLEHPWRSIGAALILPMIGFWAAGQMAEQFFPPSDRNMFNIELHLDSASSLSATHEAVEKMTPLIEQSEGVVRVDWLLGGSAPPFYYNLIRRYDNTPNVAQAMVTTRDYPAANAAIPRLQRQLDEQFPQAQVLVRKLEQGPPFNAPVEVRLFGTNLAVLSEIGDQIKQLMVMAEDVTHVRTTLAKGRPKAHLQVDENQVRRAGLAPVTLAGQLQASLDGVVGGSILEATESLPVRVRIGEQARRTPDDLNRLHLAGAAATPALNLTSLGDISFVPAAGAIARRQGERVNTIEAYLRADVLPSTVQQRIAAALENQDLQLPPGYRLEFGGESAERDSAVGNLLASVGMIMVLLITTVVLSFNSFRLSAIVFAVAGLSAGLGLLSVWAFGYPFGFQVIVGLMGLIGLAINAAIVIMAELKSDAQAVRGEISAVMQGVTNCSRHIGSTTITTLGGFMPLILDGGGFWPPFALAIAGGTVLTTILSFLFVPAAFRLFALRRPFTLTEETPGDEDGPAQPLAIA